MRQAPTVLEDLGNLGDFLGGIGVVITLAYLAVQIRQNTSQLRSDAESRRVESLDEVTRALGAWQSDILSNSEVADIWRRGLSGDSDLTETESFRFVLVASGLIQIWQSNYRRSAHSNDPDNWEVTSKFIRFLLQKPGFSEFWRLDRENYLGSFRDEIDRLQLDATRRITIP
jgi:hypothetical protein